MKNRASFVLLAVAVSFLAPARGRAGPLPEGSFKGTTPFLGGPDVMALLVRKDPGNPSAYYAVLAEYDRLCGIPAPERLKITRWVPRLYAYRAEEIGRDRYAMKPLRVSAAGDIEVDGQAVADSLTLAKPGTMDGATLIRFNRNSVTTAETVTFSGRAGSTWEDYVPGKYFGSKDASGGDYLKKDVNMTLSPDKVADFFQQDIRGQFQVAEKAPGMFTFAAKSPGNLGNDKVVTRIGVFVDIVNWKPIFTTEELLLINPDDARDVGFYYERR
ncbi:MAG: hypothetical protein HY554_05745 [Elusimicrobia bacterium]|nr:hypothetical protein [Elusimicrobiota bacterium]